MKRNFGLDIYRSLAILMVLACHSVASFYASFFSATPLIYLLGLGVEVFFALSGFLIGGILIRDIVEQPRPVSAPRKLFSFYIRRWLRTLPLYYLMVVVSIFYPQWPNFSLHVSLDRSTLLANLLFIQNFQPQWQALQPVSWSLAIEEWFYLLIAPALLIISLVQRRPLRQWLVFAFGAVVILATLGYRLSDFVVNHDNWDIQMRQQIFMHMDALMFGVLAAWLSYYYKPLYSRLAHSRIFGAIALVVVGFIAYRFVYSSLIDPTINDSPLAPSLAISLMGAGFAGLVMVFQARFPTPGKAPAWVVRAFEHISTRSYAYYLIHWPFVELLERARIAGALAQHIGLDIVALALTFVVGEVAHQLWERPFMGLRNYIQLIPTTSPVPAVATVLAPSQQRPGLTPAELEEMSKLAETLVLPRVRD